MALVTLGDRPEIIGITRQVRQLRHRSDEAVPVWIEPETAGPVMSFYGPPITRKMTSR